MELKDAFNLSDHIQNIEYLYKKALEKANTLPEYIPFLEVGTRAGGTALSFLFAIKESGKKKRPLFTVDPYGEKPYLKGNEILYSHYGEDFQRVAMHMLSKFCLDNKLIHQHWRMTSLGYMGIRNQIDIWYEEKLLENTYGLVYLDGDHEENTVAAEINYFFPKLCSGGLLVIDDSEHIINSQNLTIQDFLKTTQSNGNRLYKEKP
jgi:hypothetical protein